MTDSNTVNMEEISLLVENQTFTVKKNLLCECSDYFRAMFSGNYVETEKQEITIDVEAVNADSMKIIVRYIEMGLIDITDYEYSVIDNLATAANFLQITELTKQIEYCLNLNLSNSNWVETRTIAQNAAYNELEQAAAAYGLLNFKTMTIGNIHSIELLTWFLSHPYLDTDNELDVFKFGLQWIIHRETGADALLIILGCLDLKKICAKDLEGINDEIKKHLFTNSLAEKVVECLMKVILTKRVSEEEIKTQKQDLCETFSERVYIEVLNLAKQSKERKLTYTSAVPVWMIKDSKLDYTPHFMYTFTEEKGFERWLEVADKNLWGWNVVSWGPNRLVIVGGEHGRGGGTFMRDVKVYYIWRKEWICHGVQLPPRRHGGAVMVGDTLYLVGGVGEFRVTLDTGITYDMNTRSFRETANLPIAIQSPAICTHKGEVYAAVDHTNVYKYDDKMNDHKGQWILAASTDVRLNKMISFKDYIYLSQNYFSNMFRFRPGVVEKPELVTNFGHPAAAICNLKDRLIIFSRPICMNEDCVNVEEYTEPTPENCRVILVDHNAHFTINDVAGCCTVILDYLPIQNSLSHYHKKYLSQYT